MKALEVILKAKDWDSFQSLVSPLTTKQKGDAFELLVKLYLKTDPKYITLFNNVWLLEEMPIKLLKKLGQPSTDEGVDLYAETKEGEYWAIQAKYKSDSTSTVTRKDLTTFTDLAFVKTNKINFGLICQSTNQYTKKFEGYDQLGFLTNEVWGALTENDFKSFQSLLKTPEKPKIIKPYTPRPHQKKAIKSAKNHYIKYKNNRGKLILPCGTGKSLTGYWIGRDFKSKSIIVCVPSLNIIKQTLDAWCRESYANNIEIDWICVCSDQSVGRLDNNVIYTQNLGVQVDTDIDKTAQFLKKKSNKIKVVFTTYQSGKVISTASQKANIKFDLGIFDEAHKTVGSKDKLFSHLLFEENIKIKKRVFMTATEKRYRGSSYQILSMDDPEMYGETFELMTFKEAIELKKPILTDYKVITVCVDDSEYKDFIENNTYVKPKKGNWDKEMEMKSLTSLIALRKAINKYDIKHAITFHNSIAKAEAFQESNEKINDDFPSFKKVETFHVTGKTNTAIRTKTLKEFSQAKRAIITNARCLTEGIDVKNVDCVLFADPKKSTVDIVQAVGRALRLSEGKNYGYVIIPIQTHSQEGILEIKEESYTALVNVLRSLASNDERIIEYFKSIASGSRSKGIQIEIDIDEKLAKDISLYNFENQLGLNIWKKLGKLSWMEFEKARKYVHKLNLKSYTQWISYSKGQFKELGIRPFNIPSNPRDVYLNDGWKGFGDWLGTYEIAPRNKIFIEYIEAIKFVHTLNMKSNDEWRKYCKGELKDLSPKPNNIPYKPERTYKNNGWKSWGDWLGTNRIATNKIDFSSYKEANLFVRKLNLSSGTEWRKYCKGELKGLPPKPDNIPYKPERVYKNNGWKSWGDWLGTNRIADSLKVYRHFTEARLFIHSLNLKSNKEWRKYCKGEFNNLIKLPIDIPKTPERVYKNNGWKSWGDWLGTNRTATNKIEFWSFEKSKSFVKTLNLNSSTEWKKYCNHEFKNLPKKPDEVPSTPARTYKNKGWINWPDFL